MREVSPRWFIVAAAVVAAWAGHQAFALHAKDLLLSSIPSQQQVMEEDLATVRSAIHPGSAILMVNLPGDWLQAQFVQDQLRVQCKDPSLTVMVLTTMPDTRAMGEHINLRTSGKDTVTVESKDGSPIMARGHEEFPWVTFSDHREFTTADGLKATLLRGQGDSCWAARFVVPRPVSEMVIMQWSPNPNLRLITYYRRLYSHLRIVSLSQTLGR
jgi:hypothetical protein